MVKESPKEEEPLERSLKKTMTTLVVGCETARARKRIYLSEEGRKEETREMRLVVGEKRGWGRGRG